MMCESLYEYEVLKIGHAIHFGYAPDTLSETFQSVQVSTKSTRNGEYHTTNLHPDCFSHNVIVLWNSQQEIIRNITQTQKFRKIVFNNLIGKQNVKRHNSNDEIDYDAIFESVIYSNMFN